MSLKVSISGVRGVWGDSLNWEVISKYASSFAHYVLAKGGTKVLVGRDSRLTGSVMSNFVVSIFNMMGLDVVDLGIIPTPVVLYGVREENFDAGVVFSASHNPIEWNAFKFVNSMGVFTDQQDIDHILSYFEVSPTLVRWDKIGQKQEDNSLVSKYLDHILTGVDVELIKNANLKVLVDPVNGAGSIITKSLLESLSVESYFCHDQIHGHFDHPAEPNPQNLLHLKDLVLKYGVDIAFAQDPDADRLVVANEKGVVLSEEMTGVLALKTLLDRGERGIVIVNMSTSNMAYFLNQECGQMTYRSAVGEANVVAKIKELDAMYGIEGNGGVIYPRANLARDSLVGILLILELLARHKQALSEIMATIPHTYMRKEKYLFQGEFADLSNMVKQIFSEVIFDESDGLWTAIDDGQTWFHLRVSNTEPIIRLIAESPSKELLDQIITKVANIIKN